MAKKIFNDSGNFTPKESRKGEGKTLPAWEFFYTGTLWRLTRGLRGINLKSLPKSVFLPMEGQ